MFAACIEPMGWYACYTTVMMHHLLLLWWLPWYILTNSCNYLSIKAKVGCSSSPWSETFSNSKTPEQPCSSHQWMLLPVHTELFISNIWVGFIVKNTQKWNNKANLRDLIAATGLVISNWIQIVNFSAHVTMKFDGWPRKTIGHFFYITSSFVHHFKSIGEFKQDSQSRNAQFRSKLVICYPLWPWNLMDDLEKQ